MLMATQRDVMECENVITKNFRDFYKFNKVEKHIYLGVRKIGLESPAFDTVRPIHFLQKQMTLPQYS